MRHLLTIVASVLLGFAPASNAAYFDFQAWIATNGNGEQGFDNSSPFALTDAGLTLTATAFEEPGMINIHVYMDDAYNGIIGGMGVCTTLTSSMQCSPSSDDNVSIDGTMEEILSWDFSQNITQLTLELGNNDHFDFANRDFEYSFGVSGWLTATTDGNAFATLLLSGGSDQIDFRAAGDTFDDHFYLRNADITVVPVPAAVWLFGSGLLALAGVARRKKT